MFGAITVWSGLQLGLLLATWALLDLTWFLWSNWSRLLVNQQVITNTFRGAADIVLVVFILCAPILWALYTNWSLVTAVVRGFREGTLKQTDLLAYLIPSGVLTLFGQNIVSNSSGFWPEPGIYTL